MERWKNSLGSQLFVVQIACLISTLNGFPSAAHRQVTLKFTPNIPFITDPALDMMPAMFGPALVGKNIQARLFYSNDNNGCTPIKPYSNWTIPFVLLLDRGECSFVKKVLHAQQAGAVAAIIVDNIQHERLPFMAAGSTEQNQAAAAQIQISSLLVNYKDGHAMEKFLCEGASGQRNCTSQAQYQSHELEIEIDWSLPSRDIVEFSFWTSAADHQGLAFKETFSDVVNQFKDVLDFRVHYIIHNGSSYGCDQPQRPCSNQCLKESQGRYCDVDPTQDMRDGLVGSDVLKEDLYQMCIFNASEFIEATQLWWDYVNRFAHTCVLEPGKEVGSWEEHCAKDIDRIHSLILNQVMNTHLSQSEAAVFQDQVQRCFNDQMTNTAVLEGRIPMLEDELEAQTEEIGAGRTVLPPPYFAINGQHYIGSFACPNITACYILDSLCNALDFPDRPAACSQPGPVSTPTPTPTIPRPSPQNSQDSAPSKGMNMGQIAGIAFGAIAFIGATAFVIWYRRRAKRLRATVTLNQMQMYDQPVELQGGGGGSAGLTGAFAPWWKSSAPPNSGASHDARNTSGASKIRGAAPYSALDDDELASANDIVPSHPGNMEDAYTAL